jgi:hypothetical protein
MIILFCRLLCICFGVATLSVRLVCRYYVGVLRCICFVIVRPFFLLILRLLKFIDFDILFR